MIKNFISRIKRENPTIFSVLILLIVVVGFLVFDLFFPIIQQPTIARGQLIVETIGLVASIVAIVEFVEISKKPKLKLWVETQDSDNNKHFSQEISIVFQKNVLIKNKGIVDQDIIKAYLYQFRFDLFIENFGQKIGRFIKVTIKLSGDDSDKRIRDKEITFTRIGNNEIGIWLQGGLSRGTEGSFHRFHSGEKFVVYSHPKEIDNLKDWLEYLGKFDLKIPVYIDEDDIDISLFCTIQAEDFELKTQEFKVAVPTN